jgi:hypothetical protein
VPHEAFADEIAIDFPSVDHLIERERDAFLGEAAGADLLTTVLSVSSASAASGATVPFALPLPSTCAACGGRGETWSDPCLACSGSGESLVQHPLRFTVPAGVADGARFRVRVSGPDARPLRVEVRIAVR